MVEPKKNQRAGLFQRRILIIRQDRIGDVVLATSLPRELKKRWPGCHVAMLVRSYTASLLDNNPHLDEIIIDDFQPESRNSSFWRMAGRLRRSRFTHALMLLPQARYNYMTFCAGIPFRLGHGIVLFHAITAVWPVMTRKFKKGRHEAEYSLDLARAMGARSENATPEIHLSPDEQTQVAALRAGWLNNGPVVEAYSDGSSAGGQEPTRGIVALNTTSGRSAPNWNPSDWGELARLLARSGRVKVVVTDFEVPQEVSGIEGVAYPDQGKPLRSTVISVAAADLLVSSSTGPMHIAGALDVPTLSLFCPRFSCEADLWGPLGNQARFILPEKEYCRDSCPGNPHTCSFHGSAKVSPRAVAEQILTQLSSSS